MIGWNYQMRNYTSLYNLKSSIRPFVHFVSAGVYYLDGNYAYKVIIEHDSGIIEQIILEKLAEDLSLFLYMKFPGERQGVVVVDFNDSYSFYNYLKIKSLDSSGAQSERYGLFRYDGIGRKGRAQWIYVSRIPRELMI